MVEQPRRTIVAVISDFYEGGDPNRLVRTVKGLVEQGTHEELLARWQTAVYQASIEPCGGDGDCVPFAVDARILRNTLAHAHAVIEVEMDGGKAQPVVVKEEQRHPVTGTLLHVDLLLLDGNTDLLVSDVGARGRLGADGVTLDILTTPTPLQQRAFELLGVSARL